jgi:hypothetical protein
MVYGEQIGRLFGPLLDFTERSHFLIPKGHARTPRLGFAKRSQFTRKRLTQATWRPGRDRAGSRRPTIDPCEASGTQPGTAPDCPWNPVTTSYNELDNFQ